MDETIEWLARGLTQLREPDPGSRPARAEQDLVDAFGFFGPPTQLLAALNARVFELSRGTVVLTPGDQAEFREPLPRTPQAAFLVLSARRRVVLVPGRDPVRFND
jgi:hypothetical protein